MHFLNFKLIKPKKDRAWHEHYDEITHFAMKSTCDAAKAIEVGFSSKSNACIAPATST